MNRIYLKYVREFHNYIFFNEIRDKNAIKTITLPAKRLMQKYIEHLLMHLDYLFYLNTIFAYILMRWNCISSHKIKWTYSYAVNRKCDWIEYIAKRFNRDNIYIDLNVFPKKSFFPSVSVVVMCANSTTIREILLAAEELGMVDSGEYVFFSIELSSR